MELTKNFEHLNAEERWYQHWTDKKYFHSEPDDREPYTIVIPPPNVTGVLHMGHCLNNTIQDILIRRARMMGRNACWVPGTDHASIATEAKVVQMLRERGITKSSLSRDEFLKYAWEWKEKYGGIILQQLKKLGCSLDWDRTCFTMDPHYYQSVIGVFNDLYNKGFIYRGKRMINWDVKALTALSDEEVIRKQTNQKLYFLRYQIEGSDESVVIATVRPETIMGDTAIAVHPDDERFKKFHGKRAIVPLVNRSIPIITDEYVTMDFGTGALKVTPAHDMNDNQLGQKHGLEVIDILNDDGTLNEVGGLYVGMDRLDARKKIVRDLEEQGYLLRMEDYASEVGYSERTDAVVEPRLSMQWWIDMKKISDPALRAVLDEEVKFYPPKFRNLYRHWMENIKDWCISRQLWWGQRIPAWYDENGNFVVALNEEEAIRKFIEQGNTSVTSASIRQDEDCLDTWFSSWLWPIEVFHGYSNPDNKDINYYYPTNTLVTAPEIIFFWVARMIMAGYEYKGAKPFSEVYFTGIVRDKQGRKMSKSLGNSPDLLGLIDKYGADACRFGILISSPAGNDLLWDESSNEQGSFFNNKIWNALKLVKMWEGRRSYETSISTDADFAVEWFASRLSQTRLQMDEQFRDFRLSEALKTVYSLIWDDFCSWYLEWIKPGYEQPISAAVYEKTIGFFGELLQLLHPFMPFITEEIYHKLREQTDDLTVKLYPAITSPSPTILAKGELLKEVITAIRDARNKSQLKPKDTIHLFILPDNRNDYTQLEEIICKQVNAVELKFTAEAVPQTINVVVNKDKFFLQTTAPLDTKSQREQLQRDLEYQLGFLNAVESKLANERFVKNAKPEIVETERKKKSDAEAKIQAIREGLANI
ncbi:MAG: valine--tRNA ligase [Chitinophagaceae bacterium]